MEDLIFALLEIFGEFVLQFGVEILVGIASRRIRRLRVSMRRQGTVFSTVLFVLFGFMAGGLSLLVFPHPLFHPSKLHGVSLLLSPVMTGFVMSGLGRAVQRRGRIPARIESFACGFSFALGMALIRFFLAK